MQSGEDAVTFDRKPDPREAIAPRELYLGAAIALPFAVLVWAVLLGTLFARL